MWQVRQAFVLLGLAVSGFPVKPGLWRDLDGFSSGAACVVLTSDVYRADDYYRDDQEYLEFRMEELSFTLSIWRSGI